MQITCIHAFNCGIFHKIARKKKISTRKRLHAHDNQVNFEQGQLATAPP